MARHLKTDRWLRQFCTAAILFFAVGTYQAAHAAADRVTRYLIVSGDSSSGSWDSRDEPLLTEWRSKYGANFAWFRQDGHDYIVSDGPTLAEFQRAMAPQVEVNRHQSEVNREQAAVNGQQERVNRLQAEVNRAQAEVNREQNRVDGGGEAQSRVNQLQSEVNSKQEGVNAEQRKVNQQQSAVNRDQEGVNRMQTRASAEVEKALQAAFDSARRKGLAQQVR